MCLVTEGALVAHTAAWVGLLLEGASLLGGEWAAPKLKGVLAPKALVPGRGETGQGVEMILLPLCARCNGSWYHPFWGQTRGPPGQ